LENRLRNVQKNKESMQKDNKARATSKICF